MHCNDLTYYVSSQNLNFGKIIGSATGGTVSIEASADATRTIDDDMNAPGSTPTAAIFAVTAEAGQLYSVDVEASTLKADGQTPMTLNPTTNLTETSISGNRTIYVGGALVVNANQVPDIYSGDVKVTVSYE